MVPVIELDTRDIGQVLFVREVPDQFLPVSGDGHQVTGRTRVPPAILERLVQEIGPGRDTGKGVVTITRGDHCPHDLVRGAVGKGDGPVVKGDQERPVAVYILEFVPGDIPRGNELVSEVDFFCGVPGRIIDGHRVDISSRVGLDPAAVRDLADRVCAVRHPDLIFTRDASQGISYRCIGIPPIGSGDRPAREPGFPWVLHTVPIDVIPYDSPDCADQLVIPKIPVRMLISPADLVAYVDIVQEIECLGPVARPGIQEGKHLGARQRETIADVSNAIFADQEAVCPDEEVLLPVPLVIGREDRHVRDIRGIPSTIGESQIVHGHRAACFVRDGPEDDVVEGIIDRGPVVLRVGANPEEISKDRVGEPERGIVHGIYDCSVREI
ncbi:hypothetical protein ASZ90_015016 [hydrocarbon metagenome]|uniref:Uncharacterized protein n=1 Tax=hydrocarbon metagenome TaxID=938273 RepID=A0A0W8F3C9_9ZZZZ